MTALVLVHGFMGGSAQWHNQRKALEPDIKVVAVDLPGFGENCALPAPNNIRAFAEYVLNTLSEQDIETFDLLGHSMGGMVVQEMVALAPHRVGKLILYGTGASSEMSGRFETFEESKRRAIADGANTTARRIAATWFLDFQQCNEYESCAKIAEKATLQAICAGVDAFSSWSRVANLANIANPTLIIWGDHDRSYAWAQTQQLWRSIKNANLAVVPACAHAVHLEQPELFNSLVSRFLK